MYQLCPKCKGEGQIPRPYATTGSFFQECPVCKGFMIISSLTGFPPTKIFDEESPSEDAIKTLIGTLRVQR